MHLLARASTLITETIFIQFLVISDFLGKNFVLPSEKSALFA